MRPHSSHTPKTITGHNHVGSQAFEATSMLSRLLFFEQLLPCLL